MEMLENINSIDDEIPSTSPAVTGYLLIYHCLF
jgi:hypothetical protein